MNNLIAEIQSYPFERLRKLISPKKSPAEINLSIGEPKHPASPKILDAINQNKELFSHYPPMAMVPELKKSYQNYLANNFNLKNVKDEEIFLVGGTREGTFSAIQTMVNREAVSEKPYVCMPNPYYQIYGGATLFAGAKPHFLNCSEENNFQMDLENVAQEVWEKCQLLVLCSPSNPTGKVMTKDELCKVVKLSKEFGFKVLSDECYIDIYFGEKPTSLLEAAMEVKRQLGECFSACTVCQSVPTYLALDLVVLREMPVSLLPFQNIVCFMVSVCPCPFKMRVLWLGQTTKPLKTIEPPMQKNLNWLKKF